MRIPSRLAAKQINPNLVDSFSLDADVVWLLNQIAQQQFEGNKSQAVRKAIRVYAEILGFKYVPPTDSDKRKANVR